MSAYGFNDNKTLPLFGTEGTPANENTPPQQSPDPAVLEKKQKRKALLEAVFQRRKEIYKRFYKKMRLQAGSDLV